MKITIYQNREVYKEESKIGNDSENKVETLEFEFPEEYKDFTKYIEFQIKGEKYVDLIEDNKYVITREVAKYGKIKTQVVLKKNTENDVMIFKSDIFTLTVSNSINATENLVHTVGIDLIEKIVTKNNEQDNRLETLEADNTTNKEDISKLQSDNTTNKSDIKSLQEDNEINKTDIQGIKQEQITQNTNIQELQTDNTSNRAKISDLEAKNTEQDKDIQKNAEEIAEINEKNLTQDEEIEEINAKDTAQDNLIEELQTKLEEVEAENVSLKNQIPSGEEVGNPIHLEDSSDIECEIAVVGNAEQKTREGYNLLDVLGNKSAGTTATSNGITYTINPNGSISVKGTATNNADYFIAGNWGLTTPLIELDGEYTSQLVDNTNASILMYLLNESTVIKSTTNHTTFTQTTNITGWFLRVNSGATVDTTIYPQLVKGAETKPYEQYGASPSPDYPSEIVTVGQNGTVEIVVDNGLETTDTNYQSYTKTLPIQKEFVKIGDVEDTFVKVDGKWYEAHYHPKYELTGNETALNSSSVGSLNRIILQLNGANANNAICTHYPFLKNYTSDTIHFYTATNQLLIFDSKTGNELKEYLLQQYANGTPVTVYLTLSEPELIPCTAEQESILNSFYTYKGVTNVSMSGIGTLKVNYKKDLETIINNLSATSVAE